MLVSLLDAAAAAVATVLIQMAAGEMIITRSTLYLCSVGIWLT